MALLATRKEILDILGINSNTFTAYLNEGLDAAGARIGSGPSTKYDLKPVLEFHITRLLRQSSRSASVSPEEMDGVPEVEHSERLIKHYAARAAKRKDLLDAGQVIPLEVARLEIEAKVTQLKEALDMFPGRIAPMFASANSIEEAQRLLDAETQKIKMTLTELPEIDIEHDTTDEPITD